MAVLVDTNGGSELVRRSPDQAAGGWAAAHSLHDFFFPAVGETELRDGAAILTTDIERMLREAFEGRILPFDSAAARECADIAVLCRSAGRSIAPADYRIAAIFRSRSMAVATRNVRDFEDIDIQVVDP